jgi:XTP/dITP diphosphohydrolase
LKALFATTNRGKLAELRAESGVTLPHVEETGATYLDNALLKARALAAASGLPALADDSGLEVDALGGAPGVRSARYAGEEATDEANNRKLLDALAGAGQRTARFRCVLVLVIPSGETLTADGVLEGTIGTGPKGKNGFGYDPLFVLPDGRHVAELAPEEKMRISHRAMAAGKLANLLKEKGVPPR